MPDGTVRPSVNLMPQREYMRRVRQVFLDNKVEPFIWVHSSNYMAPHAISWTDVAMFGEDRGPTETVDFIQTAPEVLFRTIGRSQKFGIAPIWMNMTGRGGVGGMHFLSRQCCGWAWMFDTTAEMHTAVRGRYEQALRVAWGIDQNDVEYHPYWKQTLVKTNDENFIASVWTRPGTALVQVFNLNFKEDTNVRLAIDAKALGLGANVKVYDLESERHFAPLKAQLEKADGLDAQAKRSLQNSLSSPNVDELDLDTLKTVGDARSAAFSVPPRDFLLLVIE